MRNNGFAVATAGLNERRVDSPPLAALRLREKPDTPLLAAGSFIRVCGYLIDHRDRPIPGMNHAIGADDINDSHVGVLEARYYGEITSADESL
jgi:hypothetical protein